EFSLVSNEEIESIPIAIKNISGENKTEAAQLGAIDSFQKCETCQLTSACPGHFGKFHLTQPLFKVAFKKLVENIFKYTCSFCGALQNLELLELIKQIDERNTGITVKDRAAFKKILEATKQSKFKCIAPNCQKQVSPLQYSKNNNFIYNSGTTKGIVLDNRHVFNILQNLPQTFKLLLTPSNAHQIVSPENVFYANSILLPPHNLRTINVYDGQVTSLLTSDLNLIMRRVANNETNAKIQKILDSIDNSRGANPYATNKKLTLDTLTGGHSKESYLRSYINGKRIPETARAVIEPSMNKTGFIEVPSYILNKLRDVVFYNHVTKDNILKSLQNEQAFLTYIKSDHNSENPYMVYDLAQKNGYLTLAPNFGDIFEKRKEEGGFVTICRHPSIWLTNIQSGIIKRSEGFTINIPTTICTSFNADFDGDEMTIYSFKSPCANLEQALIMNSRNLFKNSITSNPMFGLVQDQIPALNKLYRRQNYTYNDALVILGQFGFLLTPGKDNYTGKDILSCVFPKHYTLKGIVENGELILENFTNKLVSANSSKSIFGHLVLFYGQEYGLTILDTMRDIVQNFITHFGFSVKIRDMIPSPKILDILEKIVDQEVDKIDKQTKLLYDDIEQGKVIINSYDDISEFRLKNVAIMKKKLESKLLELLDEYYDEDNNFLEMYRTGYKVNINELLSIMCFSGFKNYGNIEMITPGLNGKTSLFSLPDSINLQDYGFIKSSIAKGLTFEEYATIVKQEAFPQIVNVTTGTSQTGFLGKKMVKMASEF
ncbi:DNA-dependent RNA polymerase, partial [Diachasmimorpha longicaudata entomopoxvirus]